MEERKESMKTWQVEYNAAYWVEAETEDEAIELAMEKHADFPDGDWEAMIDPYDSNNFNTLGEK
jgi:hypothetical protein